MGQIKVEKNVGGIEGLCVIEPAVHGDARGYFIETYNEKDMKEAGIDIHFVQDNQSMSTKGVLRGLHFQKQYPQCKLVRAVRGTVFDVAVDLRSDSKSYGRWYGVTLSAENKKQFLIPEGFAHGFLVLSDEAEFCYKVNDFWHPNDEGGMAWNDPEIGIEQPELKGEYKGSASAEGYMLEDGTVLNLSVNVQKWLGLQDTFKFQERRGKVKAEHSIILRFMWLIQWQDLSNEVYSIEDEASDIMLKNLTKIIADSDSKDVAFELLDETEKAGYSKVTKARHDGLS